MDPKQQRGYLNNNPGNLDRSEPPWNGEIRDADDARLTPFQHHELVYGRFCVFADSFHGIRALAKNLLAYFDKDGLKSVTQLIERWAPNQENNTTAYINNVCAMIRVTPNDKIDLHNQTVLQAMASAIVRVECGGMPYTDAEMAAGVAAALEYQA
jgi:hypothetical protein